MLKQYDGECECSTLSFDAMYTKVNYKNYHYTFESVSLVLLLKISLPIGDISATTFYCFLLHLYSL